MTHRANQQTRFRFRLAEGCTADATAKQTGTRGEIQLAGWIRTCMTCDTVFLQNFHGRLSECASIPDTGFRSRRWNRSCRYCPSRNCHDRCQQKRCPSNVNLHANLHAAIIKQHRSSTHHSGIFTSKVALYDIPMGCILPHLDTRFQRFDHTETVTPMSASWRHSPGSAIAMQRHHYRCPY